MRPKEFYDIIIKGFPYQPTESQQMAISRIIRFLAARDDKSLFVLKGYAGTGKTTVVSTFIKKLSIINLKTVLLAPTGRAAKVLSQYSGKTAYTVHKKIYRVAMQPDGTMRMALSQNLHKNTVFIVDEASMIPDDTGSGDMNFFSTRSLLEDLINYVYEGENCKLILIGDTAQLPPVGLDISPALDIPHLKRTYSLTVYSSGLTEVMRQSLESGILANATNIRNRINEESKQPFITLNGFSDIVRISGVELEDALNDAFAGNETEDTIVITRSNKRANIFNKEIRNRILYRENEISAGDLMMVVKNNYYWLDEGSKAGFIANGDIIEILRVEKKEEFYGFRFADVTIRMTDYPEEKDLQVKIILDTIDSLSPALSKEESNKLFNEVTADYEDIPSRRKRLEAVKKNPYFNALQVKFGYALTCHKTQGGQWPRVFIDQGYVTDEMINKEFYRWLYTAFTRATEKLYLINFSEKFFIDN